MNNKEKSRICIYCGRNSGGLRVLTTNENGEEMLVMTCWKCLVEKAKAAEAMQKTDEGTDKDGDVEK